MNIKTYLLGRAESIPAWIGFIGFILEIVLHMGAVSTLMLVLFITLIVVPESKVKTLFGSWTAKIKSMEAK